MTGPGPDAFFCPAFGACSCLLWFLSLFLGDVSIIDIFWAPGFALMAWTLGAGSGHACDPARRPLATLVTALVSAVGPAAWVAALFGRSATGA